MTRWWTYAVLAIAMIAGTVRAQASSQAREACELRESTHAAASAARKRSGKPVQLARRETGGSPPHVVVPDLIDLPARAHAYTVVAFVVGEVRAAMHAGRASSRAPPVRSLGVPRLTQLARSRSTHGSIVFATRGDRRRWRHLPSRR